MLNLCIHSYSVCKLTIRMIHYPHTQAVWEEREGLVSTACTCAIIPRKTWESVYVLKLSVKLKRLRRIYFRICQSSYFNSMNVEDNRHVCKAKDAFLQLLTSFGKSVRYEVLSFACMTVNKASWVQGRGSYLVILLVLPLGSLTIAKFNGFLL